MITANTFQNQRNKKLQSDRMTTKEIVQKLEIIASSYSFISTLADFLVSDFCGTVEQLTTRKSVNTLNYNEYAFLLGLWIKNSSSSKDLNDKIEIQEVRRLMSLLHESYVENMRKPINKNISVVEQMTDGDKFKEAFFYSGLTAYDSLYMEMLNEKYDLDKDWIISNKKFSLQNLKDFYKNIDGIIFYKLNEYYSLRKNKSNKVESVDIFSLTYKDITKDLNEFQSILSQLVIEPGKGFNESLNDIGDFNEFYSKPIVKIADDKYFIPTMYSLAEAIYDSPFYWMNSDKSYSSTSLMHRGLVGENIVYKEMVRIFGASKVFKGVKIYKNKNYTITDIDVLLVHNDNAIIFQVKSKRLTSLSKRGDINSIKNDFAKAVESAYIQGKECENCILFYSGYDFIDASSVNLNKKIKKIKNTYIVCVVLDVFPAITHATSLLLIDKHIVQTVCFTSLDLVVMCKYLSKPSKFIDYIIKRVKNCDYFHANSELAFLGYYLKEDLKRSSLYDKAYILDDYAQIVDNIYYSDVIEKANVEQNKNYGLSRNSMCPCGSGKKYKYCHLLKRSL